MLWLRYERGDPLLARLVQAESIGEQIVDLEVTQAELDAALAKIAAR